MTNCVISAIGTAPRTSTLSRVPVELLRPIRAALEVRHIMHTRSLYRSLLGRQQYEILWDQRTPQILHDILNMSEAIG